MPIYAMKCENCKEVAEITCSYEIMKTLCCIKCGTPLVQVPGRVAFRVNGACYENGYSTPEPDLDVSYDPNQGNIAWEN